MKDKTEILTISEKEFEVLAGLAKHHNTVDPIGIKCKEKLSNELAVANVLKEEDMPEDVVRLNSIIDVMTPFGRKANLRLVMPGKADFQKGRLSIMSPIGTAVLGHRLGEKVLWHFPKGDELITIESLDNSQRAIFEEKEAEEEKKEA